MAKQQNMPVEPDFKDVDKVAVARARAAIVGGKQEALKAPKGAKSSTNAKTGVTYTRWTERVTIMTTYRETKSSGLLDAVVVAKIRQSKENSGGRVFGHYYFNLRNAAEVNGHEEMNDRSNGSIITLLVATGFMPAGDVLRGTLLNKMFPMKNQPGSSSPLNGKTAVANIVQEYGPQKDKNRKPILDENKKPVMGYRDNIESFLPDTSAQDVEETEESDEDEE